MRTNANNPSTSVKALHVRLLMRNTNLYLSMSEEDLLTRGTVLVPSPYFAFLYVHGVAFVLHAPTYLVYSNLTYVRQYLLFSQRRFPASGRVLYSYLFRKMRAGLHAIDKTETLLVACVRIRYVCVSTLQAVVCAAAGLSIIYKYCLRGCCIAFGRGGERVGRVGDRQTRLAASHLYCRLLDIPRGEKIIYL